MWMASSHPIPRRVLLSLASRFESSSSLSRWSGSVAHLAVSIPPIHHQRYHRRYHYQIRTYASSSTPNPSANVTPRTTNSKVSEIIPGKRKQVKALSAAKKASSGDGISMGLFDDKATQVERCVELISSRIDLASKQERLEGVKLEMGHEDVWSDPERLTKLNIEASQLSEKIDPVVSLVDQLGSLREMMALAQEEKETAVQAECMERMVELAEDAHRLQLHILLCTSEEDKGGCYVEIQAGAGGRESADWTEMLYRMYTRWAQAKGFQAHALQESEGEGGGLRSVTFKVDGQLAYGWFKTEAGVHRLVRQSPFDSQQKRHTSFAQVRVFPTTVDDHVCEIDLPASDLKIETFRAQGAGGQHVNTTDSAVRITHLPTGITASCQNDRSQHRNRAEAMDVLKAKLYRMKQQAAADQKASYTANLGANSFGSQIRSYVLHPYQLVKDHRTGVEENEVESVLNGELDDFVEAALAKGTDQQTDGEMKAKK